MLFRFKHRTVRLAVLSTMIFSLVLSVFTIVPAYARDSQFTRQGAGPMYWISYEHQYTNNTFMPEDRWKANIDWFAENLKPYGYDMVSTDGWIEGATLLNRNGYILSHNDSWITNPLGEPSRPVTSNVYGGLINGDFEAPDTVGWTFTGSALHGINTDSGTGNKSLYTWFGTPHEETVSQTVYLANGTYRVSALSKTKNGMAASGIGAELRAKGYDASNPSATVVQSVYSESWKKYSSIVNVTSGKLSLEFYYNSIPQNFGNAGLDLDDVKVEPAVNNYAVNGDFEQDETIGWTFGGGFLKGRNPDTNPESLAGSSLWTWNWEPVVQTITQSVDLPNGRYQVSANAKIKNEMDTNGSTAQLFVRDYDSLNPQAAITRNITSKLWSGSHISTQVDVTSGKLTLQFYVNSKGNGGIDLDDVKIEPAQQDSSSGYAEDLYPNGHTWKYWADYVHSKGLKLGIYYNPLWVSPEVVNHPDKYKVVGTDTPVADLVIKDPNGDPIGGDRFNGGQGNARSLYWLNVDHPLAKQFLQGYIDYFKAQGADFLRVDFLSWYETGTDAGSPSPIGNGHRRDQYEKALQWMSEATGKNGMFLSLVMPHLKNHGELERKYGDMIRIDEDVFEGGWAHVSGRRQTWQDVWSQWANEFQGFTGFSDISGRGSLISDGDFIRFNRFSGRYADNERKTEISLMTLAGSPITIADQYDTVGDSIQYYQNPEIIELNKLGFAGKPIFYTNEHYKNNVSRDSERWAGQLPDGSWIVGLFNRSDEQKAQSIDFAKDLGIKEGAYVRDLWKHEDLGDKTLYSQVLEPHDSVVLKIVPKTTVKTFQTEASSYDGGAVFNNSNSGFSGYGYIEGLSQAGAKTSFAVSVPKAGEYPLSVLYANGTGADSTVTVSVNDINNPAAPLPVGAPARWTFASQGDWNQWKAKEQTVQLAQGLNFITLEHGASDAGEIKVDSIQVKVGASVEIVNGDFETGNDQGWTTVTAGLSGVDSNDAYQGSKKYLYFPVGSPGEATFSQTLSNIPNGSYRISAQVKYMPHLDPHLAQGGKAELRGIQSGGTDATNIVPNITNDTPSDPETGKYNADRFAYRKFTLDTNVTANELTVQFYLNATVGDTSLQIDNVEIERLDSNQAIPELPLLNTGFNDGFTNWSRSNAVNQSIRNEGSNAFATVSGDSGYAADLWQFAAAPKSGAYTIKARTRSNGKFADANLYVSYSGGIKKAVIPANADWTDVAIPNVQLQRGEVAKIGVLANGQAGGVLDIDDVQAVQTGDQSYTNVRFLGDYQSHTVSDDQKSVIFQADGAKVKLEFIKDDIAKVWMERYGEFAKKQSFVVKNEAPAVVPSVSDNGDYIKVQTPALTVRAYKQPFRLAFYDSTNTKLYTGERSTGGSGYNGDTGVYQYMALDPNEHFYGLGIDRDAQSLDRRGKKVVMNNAMTSGYGGNTSDISGTFFTSTKGYGIYFDNTQQNAVFDMGNEDSSYYSFSSPNGDLVYYFLSGGPEGSLPNVIQNYASLTGTAPLPPKWALGYIQSKYGYRTWDETNNIVDTFRNKNIPVDGIVLDAYWAAANRYFDFTWSNDFAAPKEHMDALKQKGVKISTIVDPYVQVTAGNFNEGDQKGYFVKDASGKTIIYKAWYGDAGLIDFTNSEAAKWYTDQVKTLYDAGVRGWWIDLNEPERETDGLRDQFAAGSAGEIRNVYALNEAKAFYDGQRRYTNDRVWSLARSGFSGIQRYGTTVWTGDVDSSWDALTHNLQLGLSSGLSGIPYFTNDTGGFRGSKPSDELYARWMQAAAFMPVFRAHGDDTSGNGKREPWEYPSVEGIVKDTIKQRYRLLPYIYSAAKETQQNNTPIMRALVVDHPSDPNVVNLVDEWLFGQSLLVAPVHEQGAAQRNVYLPSGVWYEWNGNNVYSGGQTAANVAAPLDKIPLFVKEGSIIPLRPDENYVGETADDNLTLKIYPLTGGGTSRFTLYEDDGQTYGYESGNAATTDIQAEKNESGVTLTIDAIQGQYDGIVLNRTWAAEVKADLTDGEKIASVKRNGTLLTEAASKVDVDNGKDLWFYDAAAGLVYIKTDKVSTAESQSIEIGLANSSDKLITNVGLSPVMQDGGKDTPVSVRVNTFNVSDNTPVTAKLVNADGKTPVFGVQAAASVINNGSSALTLTVPSSVPAGNYSVIVEVEGIAPVSKPYIVLPRIEDSFDIKTQFNMDKLRRDQYLESAVQITNKTGNAQKVLAIVALYDDNGTVLLNHSAVSGAVNPGETRNLTGGFQIPGNVSGKLVKVFVWDGDSILTSNMQPLSSVVILAP